MPGVWTPNDVGAAGSRPGLYANFEKEATALISGGVSGVVAIAGTALWGPDEVVQKIENETELLNFYTKDETAVDLPFMISQALKGGAKSVLAYRLEGTGGVKGTLSLDDSVAANVLDVTGKDEGARANTFTITIAANAIDASRKDVTLKEGATTLITWVTTIDDGDTGMVQALVDQINDDATNFYIDAIFVAVGNEILADISATNLATGADPAAPIIGDYNLMLTAFEVETFSILCTDTQDASILVAILAWVKTTMRAAGKKVVYYGGSETADAAAAAVADAALADHEGWVHVFPGFKYLDFLGVAQTARGSKAAARIAGIVAGQSLTQSVTFAELIDITDVETRLTDAQVQVALAGGVLPLVWDGSKFKVERGLNTLTTLAATQSNDFKKIKIIRILDNIENTLSKTASDLLIGKFLNNADGQNAVLSLFRDFLNTLANQGVIDPSFTAVLDPQNPATADRMFVLIIVKPVDSIEYIYTTVTVQ